MTRTEQTWELIKEFALWALVIWHLAEALL